MTKLEKVLYTARAHTTGGREGHQPIGPGIIQVNVPAVHSHGAEG
jgi:hypothetical protein